MHGLEAFLRYIAQRIVNNCRNRSIGLLLEMLTILLLQRCGHIITRQLTFTNQPQLLFVKFVTKYMSIHDSKRVLGRMLLLNIGKQNMKRSLQSNLDH